MRDPINKAKSQKFYGEVISLYPSEIRNNLWGTEEQFLDSLKNSIYEKEDEEYKVDFSQNFKIKFPKALFKNLFVNNSAIEFDKPMGQRLEFKNYIYLELVESPVLTFESREKSTLISIPRKGAFFINEDKNEDLYYPKEIVPLFISQLKERLNKDFTFSIYTEVYLNFCSLFKPIKYILKIKKDNRSLQEKLLYKLCINLGLIEYKIIPTHKIKVTQDIKEIYDRDANSFLLSNTKPHNLDSLRFYLSAMENSDPIYQFLEIYHVLESYFYRYFYDYIKKLTPVKSKKEFDQIRETIKEEKMLKLVIEDISNEFHFIQQEFMKIQNFRQFCEDILNRNDIDPANWDEHDIDKLSNKLSDFIYSIRNNIVHTKESDKAIRNLSRSEQDVLMEVNKTLFFIVKNVFDKNIKW